MRNACFARVVLFASCLLATPGRSDEPEPSSKLITAIDRLVERQGIHANEPGVAILIRQPGKLLFKKCYGLANLKSEQPITSRTMFELASVSKTFTATAVLILSDRGKLSLQDDVRKPISELPEYHSNHPIRVTDLLHHTSGLPEYLDFKDVPRHNRSYIINEDYLALYAKRRNDYPLQFPTGSKYDYCNSNFMLLATIVSRVSQKSFGTFLHDEVLNPAGMKYTFVYESPKAVPDLRDPEDIRATGYEWRRKKQTWDATWGVPPDRHEEVLAVGDGSVWTNLEDMSKWDLAVRSRKFLKPETWKLALTPSKTTDGEVFDYGLGWMPYFDEPNEIYGYGHDGSWGGFNTTYYHYLTHDRTTVLLSNRGNIDTDKLWSGLDKIVENNLSR